MALTLSAREISQLDRAMRALLTPFDDVSSDQWRLRVNREIRAFVDAQKAVFLLPMPGAPPVVSEDIEARVLENYLEYYHTVDEGMQRQQHTGEPVWSVLTLVDPIRHKRSEIWSDWKAPNGLWGASGISLLVESLPTSFACYDRDEDASREERQLELLRMVRPAFEAGVRTCIRNGTRIGRLMASVDLLRDAVAFVDGSGRLLHCNPTLRALLEAEPRRAALEATMIDLGRSVARLRGGRSKVWDLRGPGAVMRRLAGNAGEYACSAVLTGVQVTGGQEIVLVTVQPPGLQLPSVRQLQQRFGLSPREAQVAHAVARGQTTPQIAAALGVSAHTARHHLERLFARLGVHSRLELTTHLLSTNGAQDGRSATSD